MLGKHNEDILTGLFAGGHVLQVYRSDYHRALGRFLTELGVVDPGRLR